MNQLAKVEPSPDILRAKLFGRFEIDFNDEPWIVKDDSLAQSILAYLLLNSSRRHSRSYLIDLMLPNTQSIDARRLLTRALFQLRQQLGSHNLETDADLVWLSPCLQVETDAAQFSSIVKRHSAEEDKAKKAQHVYTLIDLYQGDLLPSLQSEWIYSTRSDLQRQFEFYSEQLVAHEKRQGNFEAAIAVAQQCLEHCPLNESLVIEQILLHSALGQTKYALQVYERYRSTLNKQLSIKPSASIQELASKVKARLRRNQAIYLPNDLTQTSSHTSKNSISSRLVGHHEVRTQLNEHCNHLLRQFEHKTNTRLVARQLPMRGRRGELVLLEGEIGVGKSRLVRHVADEFRWRGGEVLMGHCTTHSAQSFQPLLDALRQKLTPLRLAELDMVVEPQWLDVMIQLMPSLQSVMGDWESPTSLAPVATQIRVLEAFFRVLDGWSRLVPIMLIIDDMHEADVDTLAVIDNLCNRLALTDIVIVCIYQSTEVRANRSVWDWLVQQAAKPNCSRLKLGPLSKEETAELVETVLPNRINNQHFHQYVYHKSKGNPLVVIELLNTLKRQHALPAHTLADWSPPPKLAVGETIKEMMTNRLNLLLPIERQLVNAAAVIGEQFTLKLLQQTTGVEPIPLAVTVSHLCESGIYERCHDHYRFAHSQLQIIAYAQIPAAAKRKLHAATAAALAHIVPPPSEQLVRHFTVSENWIQAIEHTIIAAQRQMQLCAYYTAHGLLEAGLRLLRANVSSKALSSPSQLEYMLLSLLQQLNHSVPENGHAEQRLQRLIVLSHESGQPELRVKAYIRRAAHHLFRRTFHEAIEAGVLAEQLAYKADSPHMQANALEMVGLAMFEAAQYVSAEFTFRKAINHLAKQPDDKLLLARLTDHHLTVCKHLACFDTTTHISQLLTPTAAENAFIAAYQNRLNSFVAHHNADWHNSIASAQEAASAFYRLGCMKEAAAVLIELAQFELEAGHFKPAYDALMRAEKLAHNLYDESLTISINLAFGAFFTAVGQYDHAIAALNVALHQPEQSQLVQVIARCILTQIYFENDEVEKVTAHLGPLLQAQKSSQTLLIDYKTHLFFGRYYLFKSDVRRAQVHFQRAKEAACQTSHHAWHQRAQAYVAHVQTAEGSGTQSDLPKRSTMVPPTLDTEIKYLYWQKLLSSKSDKLAEEALLAAYASIENLRTAMPERKWQHQYFSSGFRKQIVKSMAQLNAQRKAGTHQVMLASKDAPTSGRPPTDAELISVVWTINAPEDAEIANKRDRRRHRILRLVAEAVAHNAIPTVDDLAQVLETSKRTLLYDLKELRAMGHTITTKGSR